MTQTRIGVCARCGGSFAPYIKARHVAKGYLSALCLSCNRSVQKQQNKALRSSWATSGDWKRFLTLYKKAMKCSNCGYDYHSCSLHNHHINEKTKRFSLHYSDHRHSWEDLVSELLVTDVFCANCHALIHNNVIRCPGLRTKRLKVIREIIHNFPKTSFSFSVGLRERLGLSPLEAVAEHLPRGRTPRPVARNDSRRTPHGHRGRSTFRA